MKIKKLLGKLSELEFKIKELKASQNTVLSNINKLTKINMLPLLILSKLAFSKTQREYYRTKIFEILKQPYKKNN